MGARNALREKTPPVERKRERSAKKVNYPTAHGKDNPLAGGSHRANSFTAGKPHRKSWPSAYDVSFTRISVYSPLLLRFSKK
jgi:hypothetical protein